MKIILTLIILSATCYAQTITVDPNSIIEADGLVSVDMRLTITSEQYRAMQSRLWTFDDVIERSGLLRRFVWLVKEVKQILSNGLTIAELERARYAKENGTD